jgi:hypothetical protein
VKHGGKTHLLAAAVEAGREGAARGAATGRKAANRERQDPSRPGLRCACAPARAWKRAPGSAMSPPDPGQSQAWKDVRACGPSRRRAQAS